MNFKLSVPLAAGMLLLAGCSVADEENADDAGSEAETASSPTPIPTVTETVTATPDPEIEAAGANDEARADAGADEDAIPARFHGTFVENREQCGFRGHQVYDVKSDRVDFFESSGILQDLRVDGDYAAATLSEQYGDAPPAVYVFYMAIEGPDTMRIRYDNNPRTRVYRCP